MHFYYRDGGSMIFDHTGGHTPYLISTIFYRFLEGAIANIVIHNEYPALKNVHVSARLFTDRHTDTQIQRQTDRHDQCYDRTIKNEIVNFKQSA